MAELVSTTLYHLSVTEKRVIKVQSPFPVLLYTVFQTTSCHENRKTTRVEKTSCHDHACNNIQYARTRNVIYNVHVNNAFSEWNNVNFEGDKFPF